MTKYLRGGLVFILFVGMEPGVFAISGGFIGNEVPSARSAGQGYVGVAGQNNDPSAVFTNPAAITSLKGTQVSFGAHYENVRSSYEDNSGNETKARMTNAVVPNLSMVQNLMDGKLAIGLSVQSPYGLETHWDDNSPMRYVATNSRLALIDITPAVAYQINSKVSIGAGVDYFNMFQAQLDRQMNVDAVNTALGFSTVGSGDATASLQGQAASWGYHAGVVYQPAEQHALGVAYHSKIDLRVNGNLTIRNMSGAMAALFGGSDYSTSAYTDIVLPANIQFGYAYKPTEKWILEVDAAWYQWKSGNDVNVRYAESDPSRLALLNTGNPIPLNPRNSWGIASGANYKMNDKWQLRGGGWYIPSVLPESTFSPAFMDLSRYGFSGGAGYTITKNIEIDMSYSAVFFHSRTINNNVQENSTGIPDGATVASGTAGSNGKYSNFANLLALNITYRFGNSK